MHHRRTAPLGMSVLLLLLALAAAQGAGLGPLRIDLRADPNRLQADGKSQATIVADIATLTGAPVPDGTPVRFTTTLGTIVSPVQTLGGLAQTSLTASSESGYATVSVIVAGSRQTLQIVFSALPGSRVAGERVAELRADEIAYSADRGLLVATWHASLKHRGLEIQADSIQYDVVMNIARAQGNVVLRTRKKELRSDALRWELLSAHGRSIAMSGEEVERLTIDGEQLETHKDEDTVQALWEPMPTDDTRTWVKAKQALIDPGQRLILDHAVIYVDSTRVLSLRRQVLRPTPGRAIFSDVVGFSTSGGIRLDFPYYYEAGAHSLGSLYLRHNSYSGTGDGTGWALGLSQEYSREGKIEGSLRFDDVRHPMQGISFDHQQRFGLLSVDFGASTSEMGSDWRYRSQSLGMAHPLGQGSLSLRLGDSTYNGSSEKSADVGYLFRPIVLPHQIVAVPALHLRTVQRDVQSSEIIVDPVTGEPLSLDQSLSGTSTAAVIDVGVGLPVRKLGKGLTLSSGFNTGYTQVMATGGAPFLDAHLGLDKKLTEGGRLGLTYRCAFTPAIAQTDLFAGGQQTLSLNGNGKIKGASIGVNVSHDVRSGREYGWFTLRKPLPYGNDPLGQPLWTLQFAHMFSRYQGLDASSSRASLMRSLGRLTLSLNYSPQGLSPYGDSRPWINPFAYGYTYSGGKKLWLEVGSPID